MDQLCSLDGATGVGDAGRVRGAGGRWVGSRHAAGKKGPQPRWFPKDPDQGKIEAHSFGWIIVNICRLGWSDAARLSEGCDHSYIYRLSRISRVPRKFRTAKCLAQTAKLLRAINIVATMRDPSWRWVYPDNLNWNIPRGFFDNCRCSLEVPGATLSGILGRTMRWPGGHASFYSEIPNLPRGLPTGSVGGNELRRSLAPLGVLGVKGYCQNEYPNSWESQALMFCYQLGFDAEFPMEFLDLQQMAFKRQRDGRRPKRRAGRN